MSLTVISDNLNDRGGTITIQADSQEEVLSAQARQLAVTHAQSRGIPRAGTSGGEASYPVNADGETNDDLIFGRNGQTVAGYRCDFKVTGGL